MLSLQMQEAENLADVDENGLETIDLTDDVGATSSRKMENTPEENQAPKSTLMQDNDEEEDEPPMLFRKTKSNNFFAVDDSQD